MGELEQKEQRRQEQAVKILCSVTLNITSSPVFTILTDYFKVFFPLPAAAMHLKTKKKPSYGCLEIYINEYILLKNMWMQEWQNEKKKKKQQH